MSERELTREECARQVAEYKRQNPNCRLVIDNQTVSMQLDDTTASNPIQRRWFELHGITLHGGFDEPLE